MNTSMIKAAAKKCKNVNSWIILYCIYI